MKAMTVILTFLVLIFVPAIQLVPAIQAAQKDLVVDVSPAVLESGKMQTFTVELRNLGERTLENVTVRIVSDKTPITILGVGEQFIKSIEPYSTESVQFSLYIEEGAESTGYTLPISVFYQKGWESAEYSTTVSIRITGKKPVLKVNTEPVTIETGEEKDVKIELANIGEEAIENVTIKIDTKEVTILGTSEQFAGNIDPGETKSAQFLLHAEKTAESRGYLLPVLISYQRGLETLQYNGTIGIEIIGKKPVLKVNAEPVTIETGEEKDVKIELVNVGNEAARDVECSLSSDSVSLLSPSSSFIEELLPGEGRVVTYTVTSNTSGVHSLLLNVTYNDISKSARINCKVTGKPDLALTGMEINKNGSVYEITGNIANVGMDKALYVVLSVGDGVYPYKDYFVGTLELNDFASFELHSSASAQKIPIKIVYRDIFNNRIEENRYVEIEAESSAEKSSEALPLWIYLLIAVIALLIVGIIVYSWTKGRKE